MLNSTKAAFPSILDVPADFTTIQEAINKAQDKDTVHVQPGMVKIEIMDLLDKLVSSTEEKRITLNIIR